MSDPFVTPSPEAIEILRKLKTFHNVLISGPPGTGKSQLMAEVRHWFAKSVSSPVINPMRDANPLPAIGSHRIPNDALPSPERKDRKTWQITFHQGTKHKDFLRGLVPNLAGAFRVNSGPFYESLSHAKLSDGASLLEIDEINRGPAIAIFGDSITAIESDKRTLTDGKSGPKTSLIHTVADDGSPLAIDLSPHLYILAAMNEADTSVEPLDVAFRRRFYPYRLRPNETALRNYFGIPNGETTTPTTATTAIHVYLAFLQAWNRINELIEWLRGPEFQMGHGIFIFKPKPIPADLPGALNHSYECWTRMHSYVGELFFGDTGSLSAILAAGKSGSAFTLEEKFLVDNQARRLREAFAITPANLYPFLLTLGQER